MDGLAAEGAPPQYANLQPGSKNGWPCGGARAEVRKNLAGAAALERRHKIELKEAMVACLGVVSSIEGKKVGMARRRQGEAVRAGPFARLGEGPAAAPAAWSWAGVSEGRREETWRRRRCGAGLLG